MAKPKVFVVGPNGGLIPKKLVQVRNRKRRYTVIALWDGQRWAQSYLAYDPEDAERLASLNDDGEPKGGDFQIAAVLHGKELVA